MDDEELDSYKLRKRKEFEDNLRMQRHHIGTWVKFIYFFIKKIRFMGSRSVGI
jgi:crooked neck